MSYTVFFDLETGGIEEFRPNIQLAAIATDDTGRELATFEAKIAFSEACADPEALKLNHYDRAVWEAQALPERQVCRDFMLFLEAYRSLTLVSKRTGQPYTVARLVGHNAATFDGPRLRGMFQRHGLFLPADPRIRCTLQLAMWYFDALSEQPENYRLESLCKHFGIEASGAHDSLVDVRLTAALAQAIRTAQTKEASAE